MAVVVRDPKDGIDQMIEIGRGVEGTLTTRNLEDPHIVSALGEVGEIIKKLSKARDHVRLYDSQKSAR